MTTSPDRIFISKHGLKYCYKQFQKTKTPILITSNCFWETSNKILDTLNFELIHFDGKWATENGFSPTFQEVYKELVTAIQCNNTLYTDEIIFIGMDWELERASKYFGDAMLRNAYDYNKS